MSGLSGLGEKLKGKLPGLKEKPFWPKTKQQRLICIGVLMVVFFMLFRGVQGYLQKKSTSKANLNIAIHVQNVQKRDLVKTVSLVGQTVPKAQVDVAAKYQGRVVQVYADLGQEVKAGDVLVEEDALDAELLANQNQHAYQEAMANIQTSEAQINANLSKYKADYDKAANTYKRYLHVYEAGGISKETLDTAYQGMEDARGNYEAIANQFSGGEASSITASREAAAKAKAVMEISRKQHSDLYLKSSINGIVGYRNVEAGNMVSAGQKLLSVFDNSIIYVDYQVSESDLPAFKLGMPLTVTIASLSKELQGNIIYISPQIDTSTMNYTMRLALDNKAGLLKSGMFARAQLKNNLRQGVITVPKAAVVSKNGKVLVYVFDEEKGAVAQREVQTGLSGDDAVEVLNGLKEGDRVATTNLARLFDGAPVKALADNEE